MNLSTHCALHRQSLFTSLRELVTIADLRQSCRKIYRPLRLFNNYFIPAVDGRVSGMHAVRPSASATLLKKSASPNEHFRECSKCRLRSQSPLTEVTGD